MTDLTIQYTKEQIEEWASKRADDAGRLSRQLLTTMQREAKLLSVMKQVREYLDALDSGNDWAIEVSEAVDSILPDEALC